MTNKIHEGRNVKRIREILGIKQEALADTLGFNQQKISLLEQKETIDPAVLEEIAKALKVPVDAIRNFSEEATYNIVANIYHDNSASVHNTYNPIDKIVELYEALLESEREKVALMQKLLDSKSAD